MWDSLSNRYVSQFTSRDDCLKNNERYPAAKMKHPRSEEICSSMIEECPIPDDSMCSLPWFYGFAKKHCQVFQHESILSPSRMNQHPVFMEDVILKTSEDCKQYLMNCLRAKARMPEHVQAQNGISSSRVTSKPCRQWYLYRPEIYEYSCERLDNYEHELGTWSQQHPIPHQPRNQQRDCR